MHRSLRILKRFLSHYETFLAQHAPVFHLSLHNHSLKEMNTSFREQWFYYLEMKVT